MRLHLPSACVHLLIRVSPNTLVWPVPPFPTCADEEDKRKPKPSTPARALYEQQAEIRGKVDVRKGGFGQKDLALEDKASRVR